jgi:hypothetical protein
VALEGGEAVRRAVGEAVDADALGEADEGADDDGGCAGDLGAAEGDLVELVEDYKW